MIPRRGSMTSCKPKMLFMLINDEHDRHLLSIHIHARYLTVVLAAGQ